MGQVKSVFLYGKPTKIKQQRLYETQREYTKLINTFIKKLIEDQQYFLAILNNNHRSPKIRQLEKDLRHTHKLGSAYGQNAIDHAVKELHNHFIRIRNNVYGYTQHHEKELTPWISLISLLNASILDQCELETLETLLKSRLSEETRITYASTHADISNLSEGKRSSNREYVRALFLERLGYWRLPYVKNAALQLDSRISTIEKSHSTNDHFVVSMKLLNESKRIEFPVSTSKNGLRRMNQYKCGSMTASLRNGKVRFGVPVTKKVKKQQQKELLGVDMGIIDLFYTSTKQQYGTFTGLITKYEKILETKLGNRSSLRNKRYEYQKRLKRSNDVFEQDDLRRKIKNISDNLNGRKTLQKRRRSYNHLIELIISVTAKDLFKEITEKGLLPVFEDLKIDEFNRGRRANKRDSFWIRGKLIQKITDLLDWYGYNCKFVEPAYTSKMCNRCHNVNDANRTGKMFTCTVCKFTADADYNASLNIRDRANDKEVYKITERYSHQRNKRHKALKELLYERHCSYIKKAT